VIVDNVCWRWLFIVGAVGIGAAWCSCKLHSGVAIKNAFACRFIGATLMSGGLIAS